MDQQRLGESAGGDNLSDVPLPHVPLPGDPLPDACLDGSVGKESTSPRLAEGVMVVAFGLGSGSCPVCFLCLNQFFSGIDCYTCQKVIRSLRV